MRKASWIFGLAVVAIACSNAGDMMGEILDSSVSDADAQTDQCPCEVGPQGEPGERGPQGDPGPRGEAGPSGIVGATSFLGAPTDSFLSDADGWICRFGTDAEETLNVAEGQRVLMTGQATADPYNAANVPYDFCVAWRESGDSSNGTLGHSVGDSTVAVMEASTTVTELTPPLSAGTYQFGVCVKRSTTDIAAFRYLYGTALLIN